jgi:hypothetical protein
MASCRTGSLLFTRLDLFHAHPSRRSGAVHISRVKIANHSRIADLSVEIRGHAVIVGANDVGKTSILRPLDLLLGSTTGQLYAAVTAFLTQTQPAPLTRTYASAAGQRRS